MNSILDYIDVEYLDSERTEEKFGYKINLISPFSSKRIIAKCSFCFEYYETIAITASRAGRTCCSKCAQVSSSYSKNNHGLSENEFHIRVVNDPRNLLISKHNPDVYKHIDKEETQKRFGYEVCSLTLGSRKPVIVRCEFCLKLFEVRYAALSTKCVISCRDCMPISVSFARQSLETDKHQFWKSRRPKLDFDLIDISATIELYKHDPRISKPFCRKRIIAKCYLCRDTIDSTMDYFSTSQSKVSCKKCMRHKTVETLKSRYGVSNVLDIPSIGGTKTSIERIVEGLLRDRYRVDFTPQYCIDGGEFQYLFDFFIPSCNLLIECQGDYFHDFKNNGYSGTPKDRAKATYVEQHTNFKLIHIWEHEINIGRVTKILDFHIHGILEQVVSINLKKLEFCEIDRNEAHQFLTKYHYLGGLGNFGKCYGAKFDAQIVAVCSFGGTTRECSVDKVKKSGMKVTGRVKELRRLCVAPWAKAKNLVSFCLSRFINLYKNDEPGVSVIVSFADPTVGDIGTIYEATNWTKLPDSSPSYHYVDLLNNRMVHKKTVWNCAHSAHMSEREFAVMSGLERVPELAKHMYAYILR